MKTQLPCSLLVTLLFCLGASRASQAQTPAFAQTPVSIVSAAHYNLDWLTSPPTGTVTYQGIPFQFDSSHKVITTQNYWTPAAPISTAVTCNVAYPYAVEIVVAGASAGLASYQGKELGQIRMDFANGTSYVAIIKAGTHIRPETWAYLSTNPTTPPGDSLVSVTNVVSESQNRGGAAKAFLDMLTIKLPVSALNTRLTSITFQDTSIPSLKTFAPGYSVAAVTVTAVVPKPVLDVQFAGTSLTRSTTVSFGTIPAGDAATKTFTLRNTGLLPLALGTATIDGTGAADFSLTAPTASTLAPGKSTTMTVTFSTAGTGARSATLHLPSNDETSPFDLALDGSGVPGVRFGSALTLVNEEAGTVQIPIVRTGSSSGAVSVQATSAPGTATAADFSAVNHTLVTFADGEASKTVPVTITADALTEANETFTLSLSDPQGGVVTGHPATTTIRIIDLVDTARPTVTIQSPTANAGVAEGTTATVSGTAADNKGVLKVQVSLNGGSFADASTSVATSGLTATYTAMLSPVAGPNLIAVKSIDTRGNESAIVTRMFNYLVTRPLSVVIDGGGSVTQTTSTYRLGLPYTLTAKPNNGQVFNGWTASSLTGTGITTASAELPKLTFTHQEGLVLTAHFIANPFTPAIIGKFNGLILPDAAQPAPSGTTSTNETVGAITATVTSTAAATGTLKIDGLSLPFAATFDNTGVARFGTSRATSLSLARANKPSLTISLTLDMTGTTGKLSGLVEQRVRGALVARSIIDADRSFYSAVTKTSSALGGTTSKAYTLVFQHRATQPGLTAHDYPQGDGYATGTLKTDGTVTFAGRLADDTSISFSTALSKANSWPLFSALYGNRGCVAAWITMDTTQPDTAMTGASWHWLRPYQNVQWYPWGWPEDVQMDVLGLQYSPPPTAVLDGLLPTDLTLGNVTLDFSDGLLPAPIQKAANISTTNAATNAPKTDTSFTFTLTPATGLISGTFTHSNGTKPKWQGVLIQKGIHKGGYGYFMTAAPKVTDGSGESGAIKLQAR